MKDLKSLLSLFVPPRDDIRGTFGLLSGYSASQDFIEEAMLKFTTYSSLQRKAKWHLNLLLFLDKRVKQLQISGVANPSIGLNDNFHIMHAKVGMLGFSKDEYNPIEVVRLFTSTGNWTQMGMKENLDLIWKIDIDLKKRVNKDVSLEALRIFNFFTELSKYYGLTKYASEKMQVLNFVKDRNFTEKELLKSRFFSTFDNQPMLDSIINRFKDEKGLNRIICGSAFFEDVNEESKDLSVFNKIESRLCGTDTFTRNPHASVIINDVDKWKFSDLASKDRSFRWTIYQQQDHSNLKRTFMHSKYIFGGFEREGNFSRGKIYLGSANISKRGLLNTLGKDGNIEAGIVLDFKDYTTNVVDNLLCRSVEPYKLDELTKAKNENSVEPLGTEIFYSCSLKAINNFDYDSRSGLLEWGEISEELYFFNIDGTKKIPIQEGQEIIKIPDDCSLEGALLVFSKASNAQYSIPIITTEGKYCITAPEKSDTSTILEMLLSYPDVGIEDDDEDDDVITSNSSRKPKLKISSDGPISSNRFLTLSMDLVEYISRKNQTTEPELLLGWFENLEFLLVKCLKDEDKREFQKLRINFLAILKQVHFAPDWEKTSDPKVFQEKYNAMLDRISENWDIRQYRILARKSS